MADLLIVNDDPALAETFGRFFESGSHTVRSASTGASALAAYGARRNDVILLDVWDSNQAEARSLAEVERWHIERTLVVHEGNPTWAARELGISRATLIKKIKSYGLPVSTGSAPLNPTRMP